MMATLETILTLVGGPTALLELSGFRLLTDPTFDPPGAYEAGGVVLRKNTGPAIPAEAIGHIDAVLLSHDQHFDNLDRAGLALLQSARRTFTTPEGASRLSGSSKGLANWETDVIQATDGRRLYVTGTPARHGPVGVEHLTGTVTGFLLGLEEPGDAVYLTGDTVWYEGVAEVARRFRPRLVVLFAGAAKPRGPFHLTMDNNDAIETSQAFHQAKVVVIHTDGWAHFTESQTDVVRAFEILGFSHRLQRIEPGVPARILL